MTGRPDVSAVSSLHQTPGSSQLGPDGCQSVQLLLPQLLPLDSHQLSCTEPLGGLQECLQTMHCILIDQGEKRKMEALLYIVETAPT